MAKKQIKWGNKELPGLSHDELNKMTSAKLSRSQFMTDYHKDPERKEIARLAGIKGTDVLREKGYFESESFIEMVKQNGHKGSRTNMENSTGMFGWTDEQKKEYASIGGSTNSIKQQEAREIQFKTHFRKAGTAAASIAATKRRHAKIEEIIKVLPKGWITIKQAEAAKVELGLKKFSVRNMTNESKYFTIQKRTGKAQTLRFKVKSKWIQK